MLVFENTVLTLTKPLLFEVLNLNGLRGGFESTIAKHLALRTKKEGPETSVLRRPNEPDPYGCTCLRRKQLGEEKSYNNKTPVILTHRRA